MKHKLWEYWQPGRQTERRQRVFLVIAEPGTQIYQCFIQPSDGIEFSLSTHYNDVKWWHGSKDYRIQMKRHFQGEQRRAIRNFTCLWIYHTNQISKNTQCSLIVNMPPKVHSKYISKKKKLLSFVHNLFKKKKNYNVPSYILPTHWLGNLRLYLYSTEWSNAELSPWKYYIAF